MFLSCSTQIDNCLSSPCYLALPGTVIGAVNCTNLVNAYLCNCYPGFTGNFIFKYKY